MPRHCKQYQSLRASKPICSESKENRHHNKTKEQTVLRYKLPSFAISLLLSIMALSSCQTKSRTESDFVISIEAQRYFAELLLGNSHRIETLIPKGSNPEEYDPSPQDIEKLVHAKAYFYVGQLGFEKAWLKRIEKLNPKLQLIDLSSKLPESLLHEGHEECQDHHHHGLDQDPHYWSSISGGKAMLTALYDALTELLPDEREEIGRNYQKGLAKIDSTAHEIEEMLQKGSAQQAFVIYHPSLSYFAAEHGIQQLQIEEAGKEPSASHLNQLIDTAKQLGVKTVFLQTEFDSRLVKEIAKELHAQVVEINPLSSDWQGELRRIAKALSDE